MTFDEFKREQIGKGITDGKQISKMWHDLVREKPQVGNGAAVHLYTDVEAYTIIARTPQTLTLQRAKAKLAADWKPEIIPGGFAGHCVNNNEQRWEIEPDPNGYIKKAYWSEAKCGFFVEGSCRVSLGYCEHYDYNF